MAAIAGFGMMMWIFVELAIILQYSLFSARRAGQAGRDGNAIGTYICADLACSIIIRITPPASVMQPDPREIVARRAEGLLDRVQSFTADIMRTA